MEKKPIIGKFNEVLAEVPNFTTDEVANIQSSRGNRTYKYLNLGTITKKIREIFKAHGLQLNQSVNFEYNQAGGSNAMQIGTVHTMVWDSTDMLELGSYPFVVTGDPQANGSAVTYARRYALYAILGIYPDKDDDGATAKTYNETPQDGITKEQANALYNAATAKGADFMQMASDVHGSPIHRMSEITAREAATLQQRIDAMAAPGANGEKA